MTPPALEVVLQDLHDSEIRCGTQKELPAGGITASIDYGSRTKKAIFYGRIVGDQQIWPAADRIAAWLQARTCGWCLQTSTCLDRWMDSGLPTPFAAAGHRSSCSSHQPLATSRRRTYPSGGAFSPSPYDDDVLSEAFQQMADV
jgi:hypothetical protein